MPAFHSPSFDVFSWLSSISSDDSSDCSSCATDVTPTRATRTKRKRSAELRELKIDHNCLPYPLADSALIQRSGNEMNTPSLSPGQKNPKKPKVSHHSSIVTLSWQETTLLTLAGTHFPSAFILGCHITPTNPLVHILQTISEPIQRPVSIGESEHAV